MKKIFAVLLSLTMLCMFSACNVNSGTTVSYIPANAKSEGYFCFPNTDWGMSFKEVAEKLNKKESDFTLTTDSDDKESNKQYATKMSFLGRECNITFSFACVPGTEHFYLYDVTASFSGNSLDNIPAKLEAIVKQYGAAYKAADMNNTTLYILNSEKTGHEISQEKRDQYNKIIKELYDKELISYKLGESPDQNKNYDYSGDDFLEKWFVTMPLSTVNAQVSNNEITVGFSSKVASVYAYIAAYGD